jgi:hypothetical protein
VHFPPTFNQKLCQVTYAAGVTLVIAVQAALADPLPSTMQAILDAHNTYRAKHCVPSLVWSGELAASAQLWASRCDFNHDDHSSHGENLFWGTAGAYSPKSAVTSWYDEIAEHDFARPRFTENDRALPRWSGGAANILAVAWRCAAATTSGYVGTRPPEMSAGSLFATSQSPVFKRSAAKEGSRPVDWPVAGRLTQGRANALNLFNQGVCGCGEQR